MVQKRQLNWEPKLTIGLHPHTNQIFSQQDSKVLVKTVATIPPGNEHVCSYTWYS